MARFVIVNDTGPGITMLKRYQACALGRDVLKPTARVIRKGLKAVVYEGVLAYREIEPLLGGIPVGQSASNRKSQKSDNSGGGVMSLSMSGVTAGVRDKDRGF